MWHSGLREEIEEMFRLLEVFGPKELSELHVFESSDESREQKKRYNARAEVKQARRQYHASPEFVALHRHAQKRWAASPEGKAYLAEYNRRPDVMARNRARNAARRAAKKASAA